MFFNIIILCFPLYLMLMSVGCSTEAQYIIYKTGDNKQLQERAIKYCYGDFKVLQQKKYGPYTRASLECHE